jgi:hypothetical protein
VALGLGVLRLFAWALVVGRRACAGWSTALLAGAANRVLDVALVTLEVTMID